MPTPMPVKVWIAPTANVRNDPSTWVWSDVTSYVRKSPPITIENGRGDENSTIDTGKCKITFDNASGHFSELNPLGQWYGTLGADTPVRVAYRRLDDTFESRTVSNGWGTSSSGTSTWVNDFSLGGTAADIAVASGFGTHRLTTAGTAVATLTGNLANVDLTWRFSTTATVAGGIFYTSAIVRWFDVNNYLYLDVGINPGGSTTFYLGQFKNGVFTDLGNVTTGTYTASSTLVVRAAVRGSWGAIMAYPDGGNPPGWAIQTNEITLLDRGSYGLQTTRGVGNSNANITARYHDIVGDVDRFGGYASDWVPRWPTLDPADETVAITATGELGRLVPRQSTLPKLSPMVRTNLAEPFMRAYWPMEDGSTAGQLASAYPGHPPVAITGALSFMKVDSLAQFVSYNPPITSANFRYGTPSVANLEAGGRLDVTVPTSVTAVTAVEQSIGVFARFDNTKTTGEQILLEWQTPGGTFTTWQLVFIPSPINVVVRAITGSSTTTVVTGGGGSPVGLYEWLVSLRQNGGNIQVGLGANSTGSFSYTGSVAGTLAGVTSIAVNASYSTYSDDIYPAGHLFVRSEYDPPNTYTTTDNYGQPRGGHRIAFSNEAVVNRLKRLATEDGLRLYAPTVPDAVAATRMFSQPTDVAPELYRAAEEADNGVLHEVPFGLAYMPRWFAYRRDPAMVLFFDSELAGAPAPVLGTAEYRNKVTVERTEGSEVTVQTADVTSGVELPRIETYELELGPFADPTLSDHASWRLNRRSLRVPRWPIIDLNLGATPVLIDDWLSLGIGDRLIIDNVPTRLGGSDIEQIVEGWSETLGTVSPLWTVELNLSPGDVPAQVGKYDSSDSRYDSRSSTLTSSITTSTTSFSVTTTDATELWTTTSPGFNIKINGEEMFVSSISGSSSPQTFLVTRASNGVARSHAAGSAVHIAPPTRYAL